MITRIITGIILLPLLLTAILFLPPVYFCIFTGALVLVGAWEWSLLAGIVKKSSRVVYVACVMLGLFVSALFSPVILLSVALLVWIWILVAIIYYQRNELAVGLQFPAVRIVMGIIVLTSTWVSIVTLKIHPDFNASWLILVLLIIFGADIGAYFSGSFFGKNAFCSRVSPKKTWEGFFGGLFLSIFIAAIGGLFLSVKPFSHYLLLLALALITALFSVIGDLGVSLLKRIAHVKDSGNIFPGHGGMLDRMDSVAAASVAFVFFALLLGAP